MEYPGNVTVKIDGIAASVASVIAMAGTRVLVSPISIPMIHNPMTAAMGDTIEMQKAIAMLVKSRNPSSMPTKSRLVRVVPSSPV